MLAMSVISPVMLVQMRFATASVSTGAVIYLVPVAKCTQCTSYHCKLLFVLNFPKAKELFYVTCITLYRKVVHEQRGIQKGILLLKTLSARRLIVVFASYPCFPNWRHTDGVSSSELSCAKVAIGYLPDDFSSNGLYSNHVRELLTYMVEFKACCDYIDPF
jgi:hypothetical protein